MAIFKKIPNWPALVSVYAISVVFVYGWTIYWFLWKLPSWIYYLSVPEIFLISIYSAAINFLESLSLLCAPIVLTVLLPKKWLYDSFVPTGSLLSILIGGFFLYFSSVSSASTDFSYTLLMQAVFYIVVLICLAVVVGRVPLISNVVEMFAERLRVFLYISIPFSLLSILVIIVRNIAG